MAGLLAAAEYYCKHRSGGLHSPDATIPTKRPMMRMFNPDPNSAPFMVMLLCQDVGAWCSHSPSVKTRVRTSKLLVDGLAN